MLYQRKGSSKLYMDFTINGARVNRSTGTADRAEAELVEAQEKLKLRQGKPAGVETSVPAPIPSISLSLAIEQAMEQRWDGTADEECVQQRLDTVLEILGDIPLTSITNDEVRLVKERLTKRGLAKSTVNRHLANLKTLLRMAWREWNVIQAVPYFPMYKEDNARTEVLDLKAQERVMKWIRSQAGMKAELADLYEVLLETGMRKGEALALDWKRHVSLDRGCLKLTRDIVKTGRERTVPLSSKARRILEKRLEAGFERPFPYTREYASKVFRDARIHFGLPDELCVHSLRHTATTRLVEKGKDIYRVGQMVGHSTVTMTERYSHLAPDYLRDLVS
jgi:integrase